MLECALTASWTLTYPPFPNVNPSEPAPCLSNQLIFLDTCTSRDWFAGLRLPPPRPPLPISFKELVKTRLIEILPVSGTRCFRQGDGLSSRCSVNSSSAVWYEDESGLMCRRRAVDVRTKRVRARVCGCGDLDSQS
jgi:hypothetical protein